MSDNRTCAFAVGAAGYTVVSFTRTLGRLCGLADEVLETLEVLEPEEQAAQMRWALRTVAEASRVALRQVNNLREVGESADNNPVLADLVTRCSDKATEGEMAGRSEGHASAS